MKKNNIICLYPAWKDNGGHEVSFYDIFLKLSKKIKNNIFFVVPESNSLKKKKLKKIIKNISTGYISLFINIILNICSLIKFYKKYKIKSGNIFFIDGYSFDFLISFTVSIFLKKIRPTIFIYCRYNFEKKKFYFFFLFIKIINYLSSIKILTDNNKLFYQIKKSYKMPVVEVPVPHTHFSNKVINLEKNLNSRYIKLYFPGVFREEKFGKNLEYFLKKNNKKNYIIKINKGFKKFEDYHFKTIILEDNINRAKYLNHLKKCDFVILPYENNQYKFRTSGIFFEAISMKKKILVSDKTWMSQELLRYGLKDFIVKNWKVFNLNKKIHLIQDSKNYIKLSKMKESYRQYHNPNKFIEIISKFL